MIILAIFLVYKFKCKKYKPNKIEDNSSFIKVEKVNDMISTDVK